MVSELRSRKLASSEEKVKQEISDKKSEDGSKKRKAVRANNGSQSVFRRLLEWDKETSLLCSICASPTSGHGSLRLFFKLIELGGHGVPWIVIPVTLMYFTEDPWFMEILLNLLAGIFLDLLVSLILKSLVRRPRPNVNQNDMVLTASVDSLYSFPSGHCTRAGMLAFFFIANIDFTVIQAMILLVWTVGIALSRVCLGRHYIMDVSCGLIIGLLQGIFIQYYWLPLKSFEDLKGYFILKQ
ncbi:phospholipid phosphatase 6-like [Asterias rubens]|uniref:phospholipid phosphatase 6-like n=1 Tax=Asterias rubens TaxID=7604 RepID=UPI0014554948|nr:phospholipid phosphatase 6-like [Asterias rubens]